MPLGALDTASNESKCTTNNVKFVVKTFLQVALFIGCLFDLKKYFWSARLSLLSQA